MKEIRFQHPHRQKHFDFFNAMAQPHFSLCANIEISHFRMYIKENQLDFTPTFVYVVALAANSIPQLRQRIRGNSVIEHEQVHPSAAVYTDVADVFSFCEVKFLPDFKVFYTNAIQQMELMRRHPVFEDEHGRDDYLFLSAIPWVHFTALTHAMHLPVQDSVPRITWGKFISVGNSIQIPLSIQVHHALVDGRHIGQFYEKVQSILDSPHQHLS